MFKIALRRSKRTRSPIWESRCLKLISSLSILVPCFKLYGRASATKSGVHVFRAFAALVVFATAVGPSNAQQMQGCEEHAQIRKRLETKYRETLAAIATNQFGWLIELYVSADGKTWALVGTRPNGPACVFGVGADWQMVAPIAGNPM